jgi:uncharacterized HAD superfamily protein
LAKNLAAQDATLQQQLEVFVANKAGEIVAKHDKMLASKAELESLVVSNASALKQNHSLKDFVYSAPVQELSNKILELRNLTYDSIKLLSSNGRFGTNKDTVYMINKVQL